MKRALAAVALVNAARLLLAPTFELVPQEAYYYLYSQHLALSYFDHPPAIALALRLFTALLGRRELALRLTAFTLTCGLQWSFFALARRFLPRARAELALLLFATTGMVTVLSLISLPDVPLLLFWSLALLALARALFDEHRASWLWAGLFMGLAFDSKYTGAFLQLGLALFLVVSPRHRKLLKTPYPYLSIAVAHAAMLPVYLWNAQHGFASFLFQSRDRAAGGFHLGLRWLAGLAGSQAVLVGPVLLAALVVALTRGPPELIASRRRRLFLLCFALPLFALCAVLALGAQVKPNWLLPCYVTGIILVARTLPLRLARASLWISGALHALALVEILFYPVPIRSDDTWYGWRALSAQVARLADAEPGAFLVSADQYKTTAELLFYQSRKVYGPNVLGERGLQFDYIDSRAELEKLRGRDALFIDSAPHDATPLPSAQVPQAALDRFASCRQLEPIVLTHAGRVARKFFVYRCSDYHGP